MGTLLRDMPLFVEVARQKSFSKAAENLDMYTSTLSRRIAGLEKEMGVPLFLRNTRNVELTGSGKTLLERCEYILTETDNAREVVVGNMTKAGRAGSAVHAGIRVPLRAARRVQPLRLGVARHPAEHQF